MEVEPETSHNDWQDILVIMEADEVLDLPVIGYNRGGLLVEWRSLRGFVPASQLVDFPSTGQVRPAPGRTSRSYRSIY